MTIPADYYVPVLRAKRAEWKALGQLNGAVRSRVVPLMELPRSAFKPGMKRGKPAPKNPRAVVETFMRQVASEAARSQVLFDVWHCSRLFPGGEPDLLAILNGLQVGLTSSTTPTFAYHLGAASRPAARTLVGTLGGGCAIRVGRAHLADPGFSQGLLGLVGSLGIQPVEVDLVIDLDGAPDSWPHDQLRRVIPALSSWRSWVVVAGVFPKDLTGYSVQKQVWYQPRGEWLRYQAEVAAATGARIPTYGDFATQHSTYYDSPEVPGSVSLRYCLSKNWLILRGAQPNRAKNGGFRQMYGHAAMLRGMRDYYGGGFSWGDATIDACVLPMPTGNAETWLAVGINHHITVATTRAVPASGL